VEVGLIINEKKTKYLKSTKKKKETRNESLNINNFQIEQVQQYKYLGSIINVSNSIEDEIKERTVLGTKAYYANLKFFKSRLLINDLRKMGMKNWKQRAQERKQWKEIIEQAKTHKEL
jgi:hypothetical protein